MYVADYSAGVEGLVCLINEFTNANAKEDSISKYAAELHSQRLQQMHDACNDANSRWDMLRLTDGKKRAGSCWKV